MKTITKHLKRTKTLCENNRKQQLTSTLYWVKFVSYLLLNEVIISLYMLCFSVLCIIWFLLYRKVRLFPWCFAKWAFDSRGKQHKNGNTISPHSLRLRGDFVFTDASTLFCLTFVCGFFFILLIVNWLIGMWINWHQGVYS